MCRWIAYRGETIPLEHYVTSPAHSLVEQSIRALESTAGTHGDGFGLGWYGEHPEPGLYREVRPAWSDENLRYLCRHIRSHLFFAHVRAATATPTTRPNCHPFVSGRWMFMHNGSVGSWARVRRKVESLIPDALLPLAHRHDRTRRPSSSPSSGAGADRDPIGATLRTLAALTDIGAAYKDPLRFTAALTDGRNIYAFRFSANDAANTLYYRSSEGNLLLVSEPLDADRESWIPVPPDHMVIARAGERVEIRPIDPAMRVAAE